MFNVKIKKGEFNHTKVTSENLEEVRDELIQYLIKDLDSLLSVITSPCPAPKGQMGEATEHLHSKYYVDLSRTYSASSLAMNIYRTNFLKTVIPTLLTGIDSEIRSGYR